MIHLTGNVKCLLLLIVQFYEFARIATRVQLSIASQTTAVWHRCQETRHTFFKLGGFINDKYNSIVCYSLSVEGSFLSTIQGHAFQREVQRIEHLGDIQRLLFKSLISAPYWPHPHKLRKHLCMVFCN